MQDNKVGTTTPQDYLYAYDVHGSVSMLLDDGGASAPTVKATYGYDAYGDEDKALTTDSEESSGTTGNKDPLNSFRYTAKRFDTGSDSLDMGARRFSPDVGRFMQRDQYLGALSNLGLGSDPLTQNRYSLAGGNPLSFIESDGHRPVADGRGTAGAAVSGLSSPDGWAAGSMPSGSGSKFGNRSSGSSGSGGGSSPQETAEEFVGFFRGAIEETGRGLGQLAYDAYSCAQDGSQCLEQVRATVGYVRDHPFESLLAMGGAVKAEFERKASRGDTGEAVGGMVGIPFLAISKLRYASKLSEARTVAGAADEIADGLGRSRVTIATPEGRYHLDLRGKSHFEKTTGDYVPTPHVRFDELHKNPADPSASSYGGGPVTPATWQDIRIVQEYLRRSGQL